MGVESYLTALLDYPESHYQNNQRSRLLQSVLSPEGPAALSLTKSDLMRASLSWTLGGSRQLR